MTLAQQVYTQAALLAGQLEGERDEILKALCNAATVSLAARLREGLHPEDLRADFIAAASLFALSSLGSVEHVEQVSVGDLTIHKSAGSDAASQVLRHQAELMIAPYLRDRFAFLGV